MVHHRLMINSNPGLINTRFAPKWLLNWGRPKKYGDDLHNSLTMVQFAVDINHLDDCISMDWLSGITRESMVFMVSTTTFAMISVVFQTMIFMFIMINYIITHIFTM